MSKGTFVDLTGARFGKLVVLARAPNLEGNRQSRWRCHCDCGNETVVRGTHLSASVIVSCGCYGQVKSITHGHSRGGRWSKTYVTWAAMMQRCMDPNAFSYRYCGRRGITVCDRWRIFENFLADMGERPAGTTLDRINNDGNYEPGNCRWATNEQQSRNRSIAKLTADDVQEIHGRCEHGETQRAVAKRFGISESMVSQIRRGEAWADQLRGPS